MFSTRRFGTDMMMIMMIFAKVRKEMNAKRIRHWLLRDHQGHVTFGLEISQQWTLHTKTTFINQWLKGIAKRNIFE